VSRIGGAEPSTELALGPVSFVLESTSEAIPLELPRAPARTVAAKPNSLASLSKSLAGSGLLADHRRLVDSVIAEQVQDNDPAIGTIAGLRISIGWNGLISVKWQLQPRLAFATATFRIFSSANLLNDKRRQQGALSLSRRS